MPPFFNIKFRISKKETDLYREFFSTMWLEHLFWEVKTNGISIAGMMMWFLMLIVSVAYGQGSQDDVPAFVRRLKAESETSRTEVTLYVAAGFVAFLVMMMGFVFAAGPRPVFTVGDRMLRTR